MLWEAIADHKTPPECFIIDLKQKKLMTKNERFWIFFLSQKLSFRCLLGSLDHFCGILRHFWCPRMLPITLKHYQNDFKVIWKKKKIWWKKIFFWKILTSENFKKLVRWAKSEHSPTFEGSCGLKNTFSGLKNVLVVFSTPKLP